jgi:hypothetical protein
VLQEMVDHVSRLLYRCALIIEDFCQGSLLQHVKDARPTLDLQTKVSHFVLHEGRLLEYGAFVNTANLSPTFAWRKTVTPHVYRAIIDLDPASYIGEFFNPLVMTVMREYLRSAANPRRIRV